MTNGQVIEFVRRGIAERQELYKIAENLMDNCIATSADGGGYGCDNMTVIIVALLNGKTKEEWYDMVAERVKNKDGPVAPKSFGMFLVCLCRADFVARFLGPGHNHFANFDGKLDESSDTSDGEEKSEGGEPAKPVSHPDEDEGWTEWKNGEDFRSRFNRSKKPGRIIHLGDGSELLTDRTSEDNPHDDEDHHIDSSSDDDSDIDEEMQVDGVTNLPSSEHIKATSISTTPEPLNAEDPSHQKSSTPQPSAETHQSPASSK